MDTILFAILFLLAYLIVVHWLFTPKEQGLELVGIATLVAPETKNTETISQAVAIPEMIETSTQIQQDYSVGDTTGQILETAAIAIPEIVETSTQIQQDYSVVDTKEQIIETAQQPKFKLHESDNFESFETLQPQLETIAMPDTIAGQPENSKISEMILPTSEYPESSESSDLPKDKSAIHQAFMKTLEDFRKLTFLISQGKSASSENHLISK